MEETNNHKNIAFTCPVCGKLEQDDVVFLCNHCDSSDLVMKEGVYMCPSCLVPGENFECMKCGSKEVKAKFPKSD